MMETILICCIAIVGYKLTEKTLNHFFPDHGNINEEWREIQSGRNLTWDQYHAQALERLAARNAIRERRGEICD